MEVDVMIPGPRTGEVCEALARALSGSRQLPEPKVSDVVIAAIHQGEFNALTAAWIDAQRHRGAKIVMHSEPPRYTHKNPLVEKYLNCSTARNVVKQMALETGAPKVFFLDSDVVPPINAIDHFLYQGDLVCGGWYPLKRSPTPAPRYVAGQWVGDNVLRLFNRVKKTRHIRSDVLPAGCCLIDHNVLELIDFEHGTDLRFIDAETGTEAILGECGMFGNRVHELGEYIRMNCAVVCRHE